MTVPLAGRSLPIFQYDANLDFFERTLFSPGGLKAIWDTIDSRVARGGYGTSDPDARLLLKDLAADRRRWEARIEKAADALAFFRGDQFYQPERCVAMRGRIDNLLDMVSLAFYPSRIRWGDFFNPAVGDRSRLSTFVADKETNPFGPLCRAGLAPRLRQPGLRLLLLWIADDRQVPAAATLAVMVKKMAPGLPVAMVGAPEHLAGCEPFADSLLATLDADALAALMKSSTASDDGQAAPCHQHGPNACLAPAVVRLLELTGDAGTHDAYTDGFGRALAACRETCGPDAFLITAARGLPELFTGGEKALLEANPDLCLGLRAQLHESWRTVASQALGQAGVKLILWDRPTGSPAVLKEVLWQTSRAGVWNHLEIPDQPDNDAFKDLTRFAAANPNIVHSWSHHPPPGTLADLPADPRTALAVYTRVQKLSGRPFWQGLNDPAYLLLYLARYGLQKVLHWRIGDAAHPIYALGQQLEYCYVKPAQLPAGYLDEICRMVESGGSVNMALVRQNLQRAFLIAYALEDGVIVGNSSLKQPRAEYIKAVSRQSGHDLTDYVERGYTSVRPEYRGLGIGARLLGGLTARAGRRKVFAVISADNVAARKMALRNNTRQVAGYYSERLGKQVGIWIPESMLG